MRLFKQAGLQGVRTADWSEEVAPFWSAVIRSALSAQGLRGLLGAGWSTLKVPDFPSHPESLLFCSELCNVTVPELAQVHDFLCLLATFSDEMLFHLRFNHSRIISALYGLT